MLKVIKKKLSYVCFYSENQFGDHVALSTVIILLLPLDAPVFFFSNNITGSLKMSTFLK